MLIGSSSSPCKSVVLSIRQGQGPAWVVHDTAVHGTAVHDCLVTGVWPHHGHHHPHAHTDHPEHQLSSSAAQLPAQMWPVLTVASSSQHRQCQAPSSTQVASMCSDRSTSTVQYCTVHYIVSWPHFTMSTVPHCTTLQACPAPTRLHPQHVCVLCQCTAVYRKCRMYPYFSMYPSFLDPKLVERFKIFHSFWSSK